MLGLIILDYVVSYFQNQSVASVLFPGRIEAIVVHNYCLLFIIYVTSFGFETELIYVLQYPFCL